MANHHGYINHVVFVLDASASMNRHTKAVVQVAENQVAYLARRSKEANQETRVSIYLFSGKDKIDCLVYDKDVLRLPSIAQLYRTYGQTALVDATIKAITDLEQTATLYGDHAFLVYVLTDGEENDSRLAHFTLGHKLKILKEKESKTNVGWTVAVLVPNTYGVFEAKRLGFEPNNITVWDTRSDQGLFEAETVVNKSLDNFFTNRAQGIRSTTGLFQLDTSLLEPAVVKSALTEVKKGNYLTLPVTTPANIFDKKALEIKHFVEQATQIPYILGSAYYQLTKREEIQPQKIVAVRDKYSGNVYTGPQARQLLGLPDYSVKVSPSDNDKYDIFVQSTSPNRKLVPGTNLLIFR